MNKLNNLMINNFLFLKSLFLLTTFSIILFIFFFFLFKLDKNFKFNILYILILKIFIDNLSNIFVLVSIKDMLF